MALSHDERKEILLIELKALQDRLTKFDDLSWKSRSWAITLVAAFLGWTLTGNLRLLNENLLFLAILIPVLFWLQEGLLRLNSVHKYTARYRGLRSVLNDQSASIDTLPLYDLTSHIEGIPRWYLRVISAFFRVEQLVFYFSLAALPVLVYWSTYGRHCNCK